MKSTTSSLIIRYVTACGTDRSAVDQYTSPGAREPLAQGQPGGFAPATTLETSTAPLRDCLPSDGALADAIAPDTHDLEIVLGTDRAHHEPLL